MGQKQMSNNDVKRILVFIVHPSKYWMLKSVIKDLRSRGILVDIAIVSKDLLEDLLILENETYINIIPEGRKTFKNSTLNTIYYSILTLFRLFILSFREDYDLYLTDDLLSIVGRLRNVFTISLTDDDLAIVKIMSLAYIFTNKIYAPTRTKLGFFEYKKVGYAGVKELFYLKNFNRSKYRSTFEKTFFIRVVHLNAIHDKEATGLNDKDLLVLVNYLASRGRVLISSERELSPEFQNFRIAYDSNKIHKILDESFMFIGDSQTMSTEASLLGPWVIRISSFKDKISTINNLENQFGLLKSFHPKDFDLMMNYIDELVTIGVFKDQKSVDVYISNQEDVNMKLFNFILETLDF
jgi:predicted glycosyltransferase